MLAEPLIHIKLVSEHALLHRVNRLVLLRRRHGSHWGSRHAPSPLLESSLVGVARSLVIVQPEACKHTHVSPVSEWSKEEANQPLDTVGDEALGLGGTRDAEGRRTSRKARAPQLMRLANGLVGLPDAGSESSMALSSNIDDDDEIDDTEPRRSEKLVMCGGDPLALDRLIRRWLLRCAAAVVMGPGKTPMGRADWAGIFSFEDIIAMGKAGVEL